MMNLMVDLSYTQNEGNIITGIHLYGKSVVDYILLHSENIRLAVTFLKEFPIEKKYLENKNLKIIYLNFKKNSKRYWKEISDVADRFDAVLFPYQVIDGKIRCKHARVYMTVHDLTPLKEVSVNKINKYERLYKDGWKAKIKYGIKCLLRVSGIWYLKRKSNLGYNIGRAEKIFTVSEYSKKDIEKTFTFLKGNVVNVYSFADKAAATEKSDFLYKDYYLIISAGRYLKNAHMALWALDELWDRKEESRSVVVCGNIPNKVIKKIRNKDKIISMGYLKDADLEYLYENAYCFIFPSISEGYGLPPAEAMKYGTRVICSNAMSLKELYEGTVMFNPYSRKSIIGALKSVETINRETMLSIYRIVSAQQETVGEKIVAVLTSEENGGK